MSKKLQELGYKINIKKLDKIDSVTKSHIALEIIEKNENKKILIDKYGHIPSKGEFIETTMNEGCPAFIKKATITPFEVAEIIKKANGIVVLAHPVAYHYEDKLTDKEILNIIKEMKINAIEACYIYVDRNDKIHDDVKHWLGFAKKNGFNYIVESDFHFEDKIRPKIGLIGDLNLSYNQIK